MYGPADGAGARLERWCCGEALGWAFDGEADDVRLDASITGFDMTHLVDYEAVCAPAAAYLLHRVRAVVDGRRFVMSCDEFLAYLLDPKFAGVIDRFLVGTRNPTFETQITGVVARSIFRVARSRRLNTSVAPMLHDAAWTIHGLPNLFQTDLSLQRCDDHFCLWSPIRRVRS